MKTIKVIDLLNKIANKEDLPKKVKFHNEIFVASDEYYGEHINQEEDSDGSQRRLFEGWVLGKILNDLVEIIEEDKEIEPLDVYTNAYIANEMSSFYEHNFEVTVKHNFEVINRKINEIIIAVNSIKKGN
jgi:hypothetical protein